MYITAIKCKKDYTYWFERVGASNSWNVFEGEDILGTICESADDIAKGLGLDIDADKLQDILDTFEEYKHYRPEYSVGTRVPDVLLDIENLTNERIHELQNCYESILRGIYYILVPDEDKAEKLAARCINWLRGTDFFTAPASTIYHDSCPCGLVKHSLKVVNTTIDLLNTHTFSNADFISAVLIAMVHDWCKIDYYESYMKNVKDDETGQWNKVLAYKCSGSKLPFGHGITSMFIAQKFFNLTTEQALAIRWHMGEYHVCDSEKRDMMDANEKYPTVLLIQTADRLSIL